MNRELNAGDLVRSKSGRDKGAILLVIGVNGDRATVVDGKTRKIGKEKKKNKHIKKEEIIKKEDKFKTIEQTNIIKKPKIIKIIFAVI